MKRTRRTEGRPEREHLHVTIRALRTTHPGGVRSTEEQQSPPAETGDGGAGFWLRAPSSPGAPSPGVRSVAMVLLPFDAPIIGGASPAR